MKTKIDDIEVYYERHGAGEPLVFSHGWLEDCTMWDTQVEHLAKNYAVIVYDHRGYGRSDKPREHYSIQTLSDDLFALLHNLQLERVTLIGFSMGGMMALVFALDHPHILSKLVLVGATAKAAFTMHLARVLRYLLPYPRFLRVVGARMFYKPSPQIVGDMLVRARRANRYAAFESLREFTSNYDVRERVSTIQVPTLIVVGEQDTINLEASRLLHRKIKGSELHIVPNSGHAVMLEKPEEFTHILKTTLSI